MPRRYEALPGTAVPFWRLKLGTALLARLRHGYSRADLRADVLAGVVVGIVALPLSMALAVASGVAPQYGLYTAIVAGSVVAALGGSMVQVSGPTAAFVVLLAPIAAKFGLGGLILATLMAGILLVAMGAGKLGSLIQFVPYPVTTGFTAGIAVVIATLQLKDFLGLTVAKMPETYVEKVGALARALPTLRWQDLAIGLFTLAILLLWPRVTRKVPGPLIALSLAGVLAWLLTLWVPDFAVATIHSRFLEGIPQRPPMPGLPWHLPGADGHPLGLSFSLIRALIPSAFAIAMLGAIESLLSAVVADGMTGGSHDPDAELVAQGIGNIVAPFFGGIAATGALARTATNVRSGARSPLAAIFHSGFVLLSVLLLAPVLNYLPMASLAALLLIVAWNMSEVKHFTHAVRVAPRSDVVVLLLCFGLTVIFDMVVSVTVGVVLAALLFMRRMAEVSNVRLVDQHPIATQGLPKDVLIYEVAGPLFFGAAQKAMSALQRVPTGVSVVLLDLSSVPVMDGTGLVSLESAVVRLHQLGMFVVLGGVQAQPLRVLARSGIREHRDQIAVHRTMERAVATAIGRSRAGSAG
ncbi:MAG TPA: C4-dicarboxylic acid transporter DauA [Thermoanaerobaculia bacterium]|jgi:SulP family sulfate permease|nr:C4-dicarboxylic acid transporter DauA [Thermoanaerobaculia bacterium]